MGKKIQLSKAQQEIMQVIWDNGGELMFSELYDELIKREKSWKPNTVLTFLSRLSGEGMITVSKQGRLNRYTACVTEEEYRQRQAKSLLEGVFGGDARELVASLLKQDCLTREEYEDLKSFWEEGGGGG